MTPVFADTAYFFALVNANDRWHEKAVAFSRRNSLPILTTSWVLTELADGFCKGAHRRKFLEILDDAEGDPDIIIVEADQAIWNRGRDLFAARPDKDWSLTDCISFVVMHERALSDALTSDRHFEQAGFNILLT